MTKWKMKKNATSMSKKEQGLRKKSYDRFSSEKSPGKARIARLAYLKIKELKHLVNDVKLKKATFKKVHTLINE